MEAPKVSIQIVTFNNEATIAACLRSALAAELGPSGESLDIRVYDNASSDGTVSVVRSEFGGRVELSENATNLGFATAHNRAFGDAIRGGADFVLILNPDLALEPNAVRKLLASLRMDARAGVACPRLLRADEKLQPLNPPVLDAAGMFMTPEIRHLDRGSGEADAGQYNKPAYVFGASGAAALIRGTCLLDASLPQVTRDEVLGGNAIPFFDDEFFAYREDADVAWRLLWLGWRTRYVPDAIGYHVRKVIPERRKSLPPEINRWSVRNRFLMQLNNLKPSAHGASIVFTLTRNLVVAAGVLAFERSSLGAFRDVWNLLPRAVRRRRELFRRSRESSHAVGSWFHRKAFTRPALGAELPLEARERIQTITAVIISYCTGSLAKLAAETLQKPDTVSDGRELRIVVVDNSPESHPGAVRELPEGVVLRRHPENLGFAGAINFAALDLPSDALLILNPDIALPRSEVRILADALEAYPELATVSPRLCGADGLPQHGFGVRRFPTFASALAELALLHRIFPNNPWTSHYLARDDRFLRSYLNRAVPDSGSPYETQGRPLLVEQPAGACVLVRRRVLLKLGGFDRNFSPAWFEDVDFFKRAAATGQLAAIVGEARAEHAGGVTKDLLPTEAFLRFWYRNFLRYWKKHGRRLEYLVLRVLVPFFLLIRAGAFGLRAVWARALREDNSLLFRDAARGHFTVARELLAPLHHQRASERTEPRSPDLTV